MEPLSDSVRELVRGQVFEVRVGAACSTPHVMQ